MTAFSLYRQSFVPTRFAAEQQPRTLLSLLLSIADTDAEARRLAWPTLASMARLRRGGLTTTTPTQDEAAAELTDAQKDEPTTIVDGVAPRLIAGSRRTVATQIERRTGGQGQFIDQLRAEAQGDELTPLRDWMLENLAHEISVDALAERAHMSRRTFLRRFREETGTSPMAWLADARIDKARELLETTTTPVERIGRLTGLGAPASVRAAFHRHIGASPREYRALFRHTAATERP